MTERPGRDEAGRMDEVDQAAGAHQATEPDEEDVLQELYGASDEDGIYRGEAQL